tara:strand:- start:1189 stop:2292 length:1104 start_codon:yes stop_codon:yes gene_type:complete
MKKRSYFFVENIWWIVPLVLAILFWEHILPILLLLIFSYIGNIIISPLVNFFENHSGNKNFSIFTSLVIFFIFIYFLFSSFIPIIINQILTLDSILSVDSFIKLKQKFLLIIESFLPKSIFDSVNLAISEFDPALTEIWSSSLTSFKTLLDGASSLAVALGSAIFSTIIVFVFMVFLLIDGHKFVEVFLNTVSYRNYGLFKRILEKTSLQIQDYIRGQLIAGSSVAITSIIGLYILQYFSGIIIPHTILIGLAAGLFNLIPFVGPIMGLIPAIVLYLITEQAIPLHIFYIILIMLVFSVVQLIDNFIMSPYIMGEKVGIHPMIIIMLVLIGGSVGGILGMLFVVPIVAIIKVVIIELLVSFKKYGKI